MFQSGSLDWNLTILCDELVHYVAIVWIISQDNGQASIDVFLDSVLWMQEWSKFLWEVDRLVDGNIGGHIFILAEEIGKGENDGVVLHLLFLAHRELVVIVHQSWQEVVEWFNSSGSKDLVKDLDVL